MTAILLITISLGLGIWIGHGAGYDAGVRETEALTMLRQAFHRPLVRGKDQTWRRP